MKKDERADALRNDIWTRVMNLPVAYNEYIYDDLGVSFNSAVTTLVHQLTEQHCAGQPKDAKRIVYCESDVMQITERIKFFIDSSLGKVYSYDEKVNAYILDIT